MNAILIIEDEAQIRTNIQEILELGDFQPIAAANGRIGLELAKKHLPDLIICDVMMPEMDGLEVLENLRDEPKTSLIPFIFLSAKVEKMDQRKGMTLGADDYLTKPFTAEELLEAVAVRLERSAMQKAKLEEMTEQLKQAGDVDRLTGLPNESALGGDDGYLSRSIAQIDRENRLIPFLLVGLDRLNEINEQLGYSKGNILIKEVAERLQSFILFLKENISAVRMEGNTFALVFPPSKDDRLAVKIGREILGVIAEPVKLEGLTVPITASIGIAFYPNATNLEELRRQAAIALNKARKDGGNLCLIYKQKLLGNKRNSDLKLAAEFHQAWQQKTIKVGYQPRVNPRNKRTVGAGTTIEWNHPYLGEISPSKIMDLAEKSGLTASLGEWMLENAILQGKKWLDRGVKRQVSVTLFPALFNEESLELKISSCLQKAGLKPGFLELEIPASTITRASNLNRVGSKLMNLQKMGAIVTLSQFNLEHTSCHYLQELAIDKIKIDRALIANIDRNSPIIETLTKIASNLKLKIVADGVETQAQMKALAKQKFDEVQYDSLLVMGNNN
ncbi:MAG: EAL domain-containing protein [Cyanobacteriota bacterium]|nr:EAL domain-containing protein [Cyanobacteriota bacterium]